MFWNTFDYKAEAEKLRKDLASISAAKVALEQELKEARESIESSTHEYLGYKEQIKNHKKVLDEQKAMHEAALLAAQTSINKKINTSLASIGVNTFACENFSVNNEPSDTECLNTFNGLTGQAKTEFYNRNKAKITRALLPKS